MLGRRQRKREQSTPSGDRRALEKEIANLHRLLGQQQFNSPEEAQAFLQQLLSQSRGRVPEQAPRSAVDEAQDVMYEAWDARGRRRVELARKALEISPDCADAYVLLAEETAATVSEARDLYERGVAAGERALGEGMFRKEAGHFWEILETRPYMRARAGLAACLWELGEREEALDHWVDMLRLNPTDSLGVRYRLVAGLLAIPQHHGSTAGHCARSGARATAAAPGAVCGRRLKAIPMCLSICWGNGVCRAGCSRRWASGTGTRPSVVQQRRWRCGARRPARWSGWLKLGGNCSAKRRRCTQARRCQLS
jgi:tetratricopeptide (TPR) repeat protein